MLNPLNRAEIVDHNFTRTLRSGDFAEIASAARASDTDLSPSQARQIFASQMISRHLDLIARVLKNRDQCFYTIGSSGHEGNAVMGHVFGPKDMAFLHYRSGALMVERSRHLPGATPIYDNLLSFVASAEDPIAGGRHKVFGSYELNVPPQTSTIASHLPKAVGAAFSIQRAVDLKLEAKMAADSVVLCSFGDASLNHSTAQGALNTASWMAVQGIPLPIIFICEDNGIGISVKTPDQWVARSCSQRPLIKYIAADGLNIFDLYLAAREAEFHARHLRKPVFLHVKTVRLLGHAGSDTEFSYRSIEQIEATEKCDPLLMSARLMIESGWLTAEQIVAWYEEIRRQVASSAEIAISRPKLLASEAVRSTVTACLEVRTAPASPQLAEREALFGRELGKLSTPLHMAKLINIGLHDLLLRYPQAVVFGEDVALKGGVYNVTDGLFKKFGARRIFNSLLDEQSILGTAMGMAHNGFLPIPEVQFLAYIHNAEDQIRGEAATLAFFSQGKFTNPMVLRIAGLPYQKGFGGHFHNDNSLAVFRDVPGMILAVPSNGRDAVLMMRRCVREAYERGRVVVFVEPIALYMTKDLNQEGDREWSFAYPEDPNAEIDIGEIGVWGASEELAIVTYANGYYLSRQAAYELEAKFGKKIKIIDVRWLAPLPIDRIARELEKTKNVLVVDECRKTGSLSEQLVSGLVENLPRLPRIKVLAADDCFIPLGRAAAAGLPSKASIVRSCLDLFESAEGVPDSRSNNKESQFVC